MSVFHLIGVVLLLLSVVSAQPEDGQVHGFISFAVDRLEVVESDSSTSIQIPLVREGGSSGFVFATIEVTNTTAGSDFSIPNSALSFNDNQVGERTTILQLINDAVPEGNETYLVEIISVGGGAEIGTVSAMQLVILANDEPHGRFQFAEERTVVSELSAGTTVEIEVIRGPGIFGRVTVEYEVTNGPTDDFSPNGGELIFPDKVGVQTIVLNIMPDNIPEVNETYILRLLSPTGGAILADSLTQSEVIILENDSPIRFSQAVVEVAEDANTIMLTVTRGLLEDGTQSGNLGVEATVLYATEDGTATSGLDYTSLSGILTFPPGITSQTISIVIHNDVDPEGDETFRVVLSNPSSDAVLFSPPTATVVIQVNDDAGGLVEFAATDQVLVTEDDGAVAEFIVRRTIGTFSELIVAWQIVSNADGEIATADFQPAIGNVTIPNGQMEAVLTIQPFDDTLAEVAEIFTVELLGIISGDGVLADQGLRVVELVVAESDDVYGRVEWADDTSFAVTANVPRTLDLVLTRSGGTIGVLSVEYSVLYLPLGVTEPAQGMPVAAQGSERLEGGQDRAEFSITISNELFVEPMANFYAFLNATSLIGGVTLQIPPSTSPSIGPRTEVLVAVPTAAANGYTGFDPASLMLAVEEPQINPSIASLVVSRSGAYGDAVVTWSVSGASIPDIGATGSVVTIAHGSTSAAIDIPILPDNEPETDETFSVTLLSISPSTTQRILTQESIAMVTILENDNAAGIFSIAASTRGPFIIEESTSSLLSITILREGGALTNQVVRYDTYPDGIADFFGGSSEETFAPDQREANVILIPQDDNVPETNETFFFNISSADGRDEILGSPTSVMITILANDDYAGIFRFHDASLNLDLTEPQSADSFPPGAITEFTIQRDAGTFTSVTVSWVVQDASSNLDISPTSGIVTFEEGQDFGTFQISALPDELPENDEVFMVTLTSVTGDASIALESSEALVTVLHNDDPITFSSSVTEAQEGDNVVLTVVRGGMAEGEAEIAFSVEYTSADSNEVTVSPTTRSLVFSAGQTLAEITASVIDDGLPEETEEIRFQLTETTGDVVLGVPSAATLVIFPSDDPNGVFQFAIDSRQLILEEGVNAQLEVERLQGTFGTVNLQWTTYFVNATTGERSMASSGDVSPVTNLLTFTEGNRTNVVEFTVNGDLQPELMETFEVELVIVSIQGDSANGARLGTFNTASFTVPESDDPYGLFRISDGSKFVEIAEDLPPGQPELGNVNIRVDRTFGDLSDVQVAWELVPAVDPLLPSFTDLLFFGGVAGEGVTPGTPRDSTGTSTLQFSGQPGAVLTVEAMYQPSDISGGFTISLWLMPESGTDGMLVAKATADGTTRFYALELVADGINYIIRLSYLPEPNQVGFSAVEASVPQLLLGGGVWHSLAVSVGPSSGDSTTAYFYLDGVRVTSRNLQSTVSDGIGELTVGGLRSGSFYSGLLQDVRIYSNTLSESQIEAIGTDAAAADVTPISGYIVFTEAQRYQEIQIASIDDTIPEPSKFFTLQLTNAIDGGRVEFGENTAAFTVLKSDAGNGVFGFNSQSLTSTIDEPGSTQLTVNREQGTFETVILYWEVRDTNGNVAEQDFSPANGEIVFQEGESQGLLIIVTTDELVPELDEDFTVVLVSVVANDNQSSSIPTSGASINASLSQSTIVVRENDYPYGLLQFMPTCPLISDTMTIPVAETIPEISVQESVGTITVCVSRAQGNLGQVTVEYLTQDGSATSEGVMPDYEPAGDGLTFTPGSVDERFKEIQVTLVDDTLPELGKVFYINLTNPAGDIGTPSLSVGSSIAINILPSDNAFGIFQFSEDSLDIIAEETSQVSLSIQREGGRFNDITIYWEVEGVSTDIQPTSGFLLFSEGQDLGSIQLLISDDVLPEFNEEFNIRLVNATGGASISSSRSVAVITIQSNDFPYGRFILSPSLRPVNVDEGTELEVIVMREFGAEGTVTVQYSTIASGNLTDTPSLDAFDVQQIVNNGNVATTGIDYLPASGSLVFLTGDTSKSFFLTIVQDTVPELDEYAFVQITSATLNTSSVSSVDTSVPPTIPAGNESLGFVIITENDDARGVIEFSVASINVSEGDTNFILLQRTGGTFGEVSVQWEATPTTAQSADYNPSSGVVTIAHSSMIATLPLSIVDDSEPEFAESLAVSILSVSNGASLGPVGTITVEIERSDDPNGALEFAPESLNIVVSEPEDGNPRSVAFTVLRERGMVGVIEVAWELYNNNGTPVSTDIGPSSGTVHFLSNVQERDIILSVQPDDVPETTEIFTLRLVSTEGGATIADNSAAEIRILPNDRPYGVVAFESSTFVVTESDEDSVAMVPVTRSDGTFGELRLSYNIMSLDIATLATADGTSILSYYQAPLQQVALSSSVLLMDVLVTGGTEECAEHCLNNEACRAFSSDDAAFCQLYHAAQTAATLVQQPDASLFEKNQVLAEPLYQSVATSGSDYLPGFSESITIPQGFSSGAIPVTIIGDSTPELNESFSIVLTALELVGSTVENAAEPPRLGDINEVMVVIAQNDDPYGKFVLTASNGASEIRVMESDNFGVSLTIERQGGTIGDVQVTWAVVPESSTATEGSDYAGTGAVLSFPDGASRSTIALSIIGDTIPERDEYIFIQLVDATGGATVAPGDGGTTRIVIEANDNAAGVVGLSPLSRSAVVGEGEQVILVVQREVGFLGRVVLSWTISGLGDVAQEFVNASGVVVIEDGASSADLLIYVRADSVPETSEFYDLTLDSIETLSPDISPPGFAVLDPQATTASITIRASNNPHGVVEFQSSATSVESDESPPIELTIIREFGTFGAIDVLYAAEIGNIDPLEDGTSLASLDDINSDTMSVRLEDGQQSTAIPAPIVDDTVAELAEVFLLRLLSVSLVVPQNDTVPPSVGFQNVTQVTIIPNDSPQGEFTFMQPEYSIEEDSGTFVIRVLRDQGLVGEVSVVYVITDGGATNGEDFSAVSLDELFFASGQSERVINITIMNDVIPEQDENFCVQLSLPGGGATLGNVPQTCVTIVANDDAFGVFSFDAASLFITLTEAGEAVVDSNVAQLRVNRANGLFSEVTLPFEVEMAGRQDLSPAMGALVFAANENFRILQIEAVSDSLPELEEQYIVTLLPPVGSGTIASNNTMATITILPNQNPYGILGVFPSSSSFLEEDAGPAVFEVRRSDGTIGEVSVTVTTVDATAVSPMGDVQAFSTFQLVETISAEKWYEFSSAGQNYLAIASNAPTGQSTLYAWRGALLPIQSFATSGATAISSLETVGGQVFLVVANGGTPGNRELNSTVFEIVEDQLQEVQSIPTMGASDVVAFQANSQQYIVFANREDNDGNPSPNVDSPVFAWTGLQFERVQTLLTIGASALEVFTTGGALYLVVGSATDTRSQVFIWAAGEFRLHQTFESQQVSDVEFIDLGEIKYLAVTSESLGLFFLSWNSAQQEFVSSNITVSSPSPIRVEAVSEQAFLFITNSDSSGQVVSFDQDSQPVLWENTVLPQATHFYPFMVYSSEELFLAAAISTQPEMTELSQILQLVYTSNAADYYTRTSTLTFADGEMSLMIAVDVIDDSIPEVDETFLIQLSNATGGAILSAESALPVTILTNDAAHGLIGFAPSSQSVIAQELESGSAIALDVIRNGGTFGEVEVSWEVAGEGEVSPSSGTVVFPNGVSTSTINLVVQPDIVPELDELTQVTLSGIVQSGVPNGGDSSRGAQLITGQTVATVTVMANDAPHGVIVWSPELVMLSEEDGVENTVQLSLIREFGAVGAITVSYSTATAVGLPEEQTASPGVDFTTTTGSVMMADNETVASVSVTILHDDIAELTETFLVTITEVRLVNEADRQSSVSNSPRTEPGRESVQVQIIENDNAGGVLSFDDTAFNAVEAAGSIAIPIARTGGAFGAVRVDFTTTGVTATGNGIDFGPASGSVLIAEGEQIGYIVINITNDSEPELDEIFIVTLVNAFQGAQLGTPTTATITILSNDDINGVFSFTDDSLLFLIPESQGSNDQMGVVTLSVERTRNFVGEVTVYWMVSEDGIMDLEPISGNVTFAENEMQRSFQVRAIDDGIPEAFESFTVNLVSTNGGGRIADPSVSRIAIQESDDPSGLIQFDEYPPEGIIVSEGNQLVVRVLREAGLEGTVSVAWVISPGDTGVFVTTSDSILFESGQAIANITIQTLSDNIPEVARLFSLQITSASQARVNFNSSQLSVVIAASDYPHGVVQFNQPLLIETPEADRMINIPLVRSFGLVGDLIVNFTVVPISAATPDDFIVASSFVVISGDTLSGSISVQILDDTTPELVQSFKIILDSIELAGDINGGRNFLFTGDSTLIDLPPSLGSNTELEVRITENDDPNGVFSFTSPIYNAIEGDIAVVSIIRTAGALEPVVINLAFEDGNAIVNNDYLRPTSNQIAFGVGQTSVDIPITILEDNIPELSEDFSISLSLGTPTTSARLGSVITTIVVIGVSDSPFGEVGFSSQDIAGVVVTNPTIEQGPIPVLFTVVRELGNVGATDIFWEVTGPDPGMERFDIDSRTLQGTLTLADGQNTGGIEILVLPSDGSEPEEQFVVTIISSSNNVIIDPQRRSTSITVSQRGMPYGIVGFFGDALQPITVSEEDEVQTLSLPLFRNDGTVGSTEIVFVVMGTGPIVDIAPGNGTILFDEGQSQASLVLQIVPDFEPELEETFTVVLTGSTNGADINMLANMATITISANDDPFGQFGLANPSISATLGSEGTISRVVTFTVSRERGTIGSVSVEVTAAYIPDQTTEYVPRISSAMFGDEETAIEVSLQVAQDVFIAPDTDFTISITGTLILSRPDESSTLSSISPTTGSTKLRVTEQHSNPIVGFSESSLEVGTDDDTDGNNAILTVVRRGVLGDVLVFWTAGLPGSVVDNGSIVPTGDNFRMGPNNSTAQFSLRATPRSSPSPPEVFAVVLAVESDTPSFPARLDSTTIAMIEPQGVVQLSGQAYTGVEGQEVKVTVWRRFGSFGEIKVTGQSSTVSSESVPSNQEAATVDNFRTTDISAIIPSGVSIGEISVGLQDNDESSPLKIFQFVLTSVERVPVTSGAATSPRLAAASLSTLITIVDDEGGAGVFQFGARSIITSEQNGSPSVVEIYVSRSGGFAGRVSVMVTSVDGRIGVTSDGDTVASAEGGDYDRVNQELVFENGETIRQVSGVIVRDDLAPEMTEYFTLVLSNPSKGFALINPNASTIEVAINDNDVRTSVFQVQKDDRLIVTTDDTVTLTVEKVDGSDLTTVVTVAPQQLEDPIAVGQLPAFTAAVEGQHYNSEVQQLEFTSGITELSFTISTNASLSLSPVAFGVKLSVTPTQTNPSDVQNEVATIVISPPGAQSTLYEIYFDAFSATNFPELEAASLELQNELENGRISGSVSVEWTTTKFVIDEIVNSATALSRNLSVPVSSVLTDSLLDIFNAIISDPSFSQRSQFVQSMQNFAYSLLDGYMCRDANNTAVEALFTYSRASFYLEAVRAIPSAFIGRRFSFSQQGQDDFLQLPGRSISQADEDCLDVHYIEFFSERLFMEPTLRSKVLSIGMKDILPTIQQPIIYRIYTGFDTLPSKNDCIWWMNPSSSMSVGSWLSEDGNQLICSAKIPIALQQDYMECECNRLGEFAVTATVQKGYGWTVPAPISCIIVMIVMLLVVVMHAWFFRRTLLTTRIFIALCISTFLFQMMAMVSAFASSSASSGGCTALGILLHVTIVAQFIWMLALAVSLWVNFMGFTDGREPLIIYAIISWGISILIVVATILIGRFAAGLDWSQLYGLTGDICFMPNLSAGLLSTFLPVLLSVLAVVTLLSHSCVYWSHWEDFHNMYYESFNRTEIPMLLAYFTLIILTWLLGGLHMYLRLVYTFGLFVAFNTIQAVYALVVYFFISLHTLTSKHKKFGIGDEVEPLTVAREPDYLGSMSSLSTSRQKLVPEDEWEEDDRPPAVIPLGAMKRVSSDPSFVGSDAAESTGEDSQIDDLMFMLKTQTYPTNQDSDVNPLLESPGTSPTKKPSGSEHLQLRRISIADTHL